MKKLLACLLLAVLLASSLFGSVLAEEKTILRVAISGDAAEIALREETAALFEAKYPNLKIEWIDLGDTKNRVMKTLAMIGANDAPDVLYLNNTIMTFAQKGALEPLSKYIEAEGEGFLDYYYASAIKPLTIDGVLYALPQETSPTVIYINKDLFKKYGVDLPTSEWTYDQFIDVCYKIAEAGRADNVYPISCVSVSSGLTRMLYFQNLYVYDTNDMQTFTFADEDKKEATISALAHVQKLVYEDKVIPNPAEVAAMGSAFNAAFFNGQVAMQMAGMYYLPTYRAENPSFDWDVVQVPVTKNGERETTAATLNWAIWKGSELKDEAWLFLKFFTGHEGNMIVAKYNMALPAARDDEANQIIIDSKFPASVGEFIKAAEFVIAPDTMSKAKTEIANIIFAEGTNLMLGDITPEECYDAIAEQSLEALSEVE